MRYCLQWVVRRPLNGMDNFCLEVGDKFGLVNWDHVKEGFECHNGEFGCNLLDTNIPLKIFFGFLTVK